jgi:hypothetical protein
MFFTAIRSSCSPALRGADRAHSLADFYSDFVTAAHPLSDIRFDFVSALMHSFLKIDHEQYHDQLLAHHDPRKPWPCLKSSAKQLTHSSSSLFLIFWLVSSPISSSF